MGRIVIRKNKMAKICVQSPEVVMTGDINLHAQVAVVTKAKLDAVSVKGDSSATKHFITQLLYCDILLQYDIKSYIDRYTGLVFRSYCTFILATFCFEKLKQTSTK